ncbi:MAG: Stf0 family sulfotransferase [Planctomycetota bacterium]
MSDSTQSGVSYLVCTTQRSGSNLLCQLLRDSGIAGFPEEYFAERFFDGYARKLFELDGFPDRFGDYLACVLARRSPNGAFGSVMMWSYLDEICGRIRSDDRMSRAASSHDVLVETFGAPRYIWLRRRNKVRQAISMVRAEISDQWVSRDRERRPTPRELPRDRFDYDRIAGVAKHFEQSDAGWQRFFEAAGVEPIAFDYEDFAADTASAVPAVIEALGLAVPKDIAVAPPKLQRQADQLSEEWYERFVHGRRQRERGSWWLRRPR